MSAGSNHFEITGRVVGLCSSPGSADGTGPLDAMVLGGQTTHGHAVRVRLSRELVALARGAMGAHQEVRIQGTLLPWAIPSQGVVVLVTMPLATSLELHPSDSSTRPAS